MRWWKLMLLSMLPLLLILSIPLFFLFAMIGGEGGSSPPISIADTKNLPPEVERYRGKVAEEARKRDIEDKVPVLLAIMAQESGGRAEQTPDIFQCSEHLSMPRNSLNVDESIICGVNFFADLYERGMKSDVRDLKAWIQSYNFGEGYIMYVAENPRKIYTPENAVEFSKKQNAEGYGDVEYVPHVLQYLVIQEQPTFGDGVVNTLPLISTIPITMTEEYGTYRDGSGRHSGWDLVGDSEAKVISAGSGTVVAVGSGLGSAYGYFVEVKHSAEISTLYAHMKYPPSVILKQYVNAGDVLGVQGNTGQSFGAHLHFEVRSIHSSGHNNTIDPATVFQPKIDILAPGIRYKNPV